MNAELASLLKPDSLDIDAIASHLDALSESARTEAIRGINGRQQMKLWHATEGRGATLDALVLPDTPARVEVINAGKNSLPVFTNFEKRFCRVADRPDVLYGYNEGPTRGLVGPGYFVAHFYEERGEVGIDYTQVPPADAKLPDGWPAIKRNEQGLQILVYAHMIDFMRVVSSTVTIGRAVKKGKETPNTFLLNRTTPTS